MTDILETLVVVKTMDVADVKAKFGTSSSNVRKEKETKRSKKATSSPSGSKSGEFSPVK